MVLEAPVGGGKRAVVGDMLRGLAGREVLVVRAALSDEEDGLRTMLNLYAALYGALHRDAVLKGKAEAALNQQLPSQGRRVQQWYQAFIEGVRKGGPKEGEQTFQLTIPRDNPLIGLVEIVAGISSKIPTVFEIQNAHNSHSLAIHAMLEGLIQRAVGQGAESKLLLVLGVEPLAPGQGYMSPPLLDLIGRRSELQRQVVAPWGEEEVSAYLASKGLEAAAPGRIAEIALGRPAYVVELVDWLKDEDRLGDDLDGETLATLAPLEVDEDDLEKPTKPAEAGRKYAGAEEVGRVQHVAALLGLSFPSGLLADMAGYDRDSVDDLLDASEDLVKEMQFSKPLNSWVYQFTKAIWRQAILDQNRDMEQRQVAARVGLFMERFLVPRGYDFLVKTLRIYADAGAGERAAALRGAAMAGDRPDVWAMVQDLLRTFPEIAWPVAMRRVIYTNLLDRMVQVGDVEQAESLFQEVLKFAQELKDGNLEGWTRFAGSKLDFRRSDLYRARDRAKDALRIFAARDNLSTEPGAQAGGEKVKIAEIHNHLALIEFQDGSINASLDHLRQALEAANIPPVQANVEFIRGLIAQRGQKVAEAAEHFRRANEMAGQVGQAPLALESGFKYGEALFQQRDFMKASDVLLRVSQIAQQLQNPARERAAMVLLAQAQGALKHFDAALQSSSRALQLTQELKFEPAMPGDIFQVGFFNLQLGRPTEALSLFAKAQERAGTGNPAFLRELLFHMGVANAQIGERAGAAKAFNGALGHARATKDLRRVVQSCENLATLDVARNDKASALKHLQEASAAAEAGKMQEERKAILRRIKELS